MLSHGSNDGRAEINLQCIATLLNMQKTPEWSRITILLSSPTGSCILSLTVNAYYKYHLWGFFLYALQELIILYAIFIWNYYGAMQS